MEFPAINDTIIAVSSGWEPSPVGIVRLSGPESFDLVRSLGVALPEPAKAPRARWSEGLVQFDQQTPLPATVFWFPEPRSYTGQDLVELHAPGNLPLLRELCGRLIEQGARRALPGEFTARAFLSGKLAAPQVEDVLALIHANSAAAARQSDRAPLAAYRRMSVDLCERIADLLALVEAGIDFVEEEDIRFVTAPEACTAIDGLLNTLAAFRQQEHHEPRAAKPHVALVGLPNAGKSTLFNALVGYERAIVSPVLGTTRDVLSAEIEIGDLPLVLQDCAGFGQSTADLELAAHLAAERAADQADLVLWVHAVDAPWADVETQVIARIPTARLLLVWSKLDLTGAGAMAQHPPGLPEPVRVSAADSTGLPRLREVICRRLSDVTDAAGEQLLDQQVRAVRVALGHARALVSVSGDDLSEPELVAFELRAALAGLSGTDNGAAVEDLLGRIFSQFCVGK